MQLDLEDYLRWDAVEMAERVRAGDVTAADLVETCLTAIDRWNPGLNAVADVLSPAPGGPPTDPSGVFAGVPFGVKELLAWPGLPWTMGSRLLAANRAPGLSPYAERLAASGLRVLFSTTSSEFGLLGSTETALRGTTGNPWRPGWSAGGSSGGAAAAVAAGIVPMAHASDAGGSIRVPAAINGLFGFKPSNRRCVPVGPETNSLLALVVEHCVSRTVRDSAHLLAATERVGREAVHEPVGIVTGPRAARLRIGVLTRTLIGDLPEPIVAAELERTTALCESLGHAVVEVSASAVDGKALSDAFFTSAALAMAEISDAVTAMLGRAPGGAELEPFSLELLEWAASLGPDAAAGVAATYRQAAAAYLALFDECDAVLSPTLATVGWPLGHLAPGVGREELVRRTERAVGYTPIHNVAGCPAMSVPLGWPDGLPVGMHFAAAPGQDAALLALGYELEEAAAWAHRRPDPSRWAGAA